VGWLVQLEEKTGVIMPAKKDAVELGRMKCYRPECDQTVSVYQNTADYLYTRCPECKADQRRGVKAQVYFWQHMEPLPGAVIVRPPNVPESAGDIGCALRGDPPAAIVERKKPDSSQGAEPEVAVPEVTQPDQKSEKPKRGGLWALALIIGLGTAGAAAALRG
jgi:hypothetical protein